MRIFDIINNMWFSTLFVYCCESSILNLAWLEISWSLISLTNRKHPLLTHLAPFRILVTSINRELSVCLHMHKAKRTRINVGLALTGPCKTDHKTMICMQSGVWVCIQISDYHNWIEKNYFYDCHEYFQTIIQNLSFFTNCIQI